MPVLIGIRLKGFIKNKIDFAQGLNTVKAAFVEEHLFLFFFQNNGLTVIADNFPFTLTVLPFQPYIKPVSAAVIKKNLLNFSAVSEAIVFLFCFAHWKMCC